MSDILGDKVKSAVEELSEHSDAVIVLASTIGEDGTSTYLTHRYAGSFHSILGMLEHYKSMKLCDIVVAEIKSESEEE
jgi:hypothetical protein